MPRIDPQQLLNCLQVLLSPSGGILSKNEVQRLANLMTKFSKKLVSKCIYVLILKNTEIQLLGAFMAEGGWNLIHLWLQDAHLNNNWALVSEVLELLLITPVDVERLKMNNLPKLVKGLTKRDDLPGIQQLATSLVEQWLTIVKDVTKQEQQLQHQQPIITQAQHQFQQQSDFQIPADEFQINPGIENTDPEPMDIDETISNDINTIVSENGGDTLRLKFVRDASQIISCVVPVNENSVDSSADSGTDKYEDSGETDKDNSDKKERDRSVVPKKPSSSSSSKTSNNSIKDRSRDKDGSRNKDRSKSSSRSSSSKSTSSRDKDKDKDRKDRHRPNGSSSSSSSKHRSSSSSHKSSSSTSTKDRRDSRDSKEKQAEKDKDTLAKIQPQTLQKLGRIPKKTEDLKSSKKDDEKREAKKASFSVEVRKTNEEKPKTVKVFNSKMRSTGLLEEAKPPPPRSATKKTAPPPAIPAILPTKRASPIRDTIPPPEKKSRLIDTEKGIKLIPPKPKPPVLQESDIFMDALLTASATAKKEPKKRKRRTSVSKDTSPPSSPSSTPKQPTSPTALKNITPVANFYQDTLVTENDDSKDEDADTNTADSDEKKDDKEKEISDTPAEPDEELSEPTTRTDENGLKGVLSYAKRKGPKRTIKWRPDSELEEYHYFELDETERVNVMKPFMDMQRMEMSSEREALRMRKLPNEDIMDPQTAWRCLIEQDISDAPAVFGCKSLEKDIQFAREKTVLQAIYFNNRIPDAPTEPDHEVHPMVNPIVIPLDDPDHPDQNTPVIAWPEPKGSPPHVSSAPQMFNNLQAQFVQPPNANAFPVNPNGLPQFSPAFTPPNLINRQPGEWNVMPNGLPPNIPPPEMIHPPMFENYGPQGPMPDGFVPPFANGPNPMQPIFQPNNFNNMRGRGGFRRGGPNNGPWLRMGVPNQVGWNNPTRGRGFCNSFKQKGFCRNRDNCPYIH